MFMNCFLGKLLDKITFISYILILSVLSDNYTFLLSGISYFNEGLKFEK